MKCFYHSADLDGHCSGAIVKRFHPECEMIGVNYGGPFPWDSITPGEEVWMVDFSLQPFDDMVRLNGMCSLTWIDHHKTSIADANGRGFIASKDQRLSVDYAACEIVWMKCTNDWNRENIPLAVRWLGRYDIWKHSEYPGSLEFQYGMKFQDNTRPENQAFWDEVITNVRKACEIRDVGEVVLTYETRYNAKCCTTGAFDVEFDGLRCIALNRILGNSLSFKSVWDPEKYDAMLLFYWKRDKWTVSLFSDRSDVDVSGVCKARGGGGHKGAAGFQCEELPFLERG
jgi:oligoribonuclease NrnB/cAMP/cGMP phosphodiesterase (DHH superfamily)